MKKTVSFILISAMLCAMLPFSAVSASAAKDVFITRQGVTYTLSSDESHYIVTSYDRSAADAVIPSTLNGLPVVMQSEVTKPSSGCTFVGIEGRYTTQIRESLDLINKIRLEACNEGVKNPSTGKPLKPKDYVPVEWSADMEYIARIRAAEATVTNSHDRLNGQRNRLKGPGGATNNCEVLFYCWGSSGYAPMTLGVESWYKEKNDWVNNTGRITGHYTAMIDPSYRYVGLATFYTQGAKYDATVTAGEFCKKITNGNTSYGCPTEKITQILEVKNTYVSYNTDSNGLKSATITFVNKYNQLCKEENLAVLSNATPKFIKGDVNGNGKIDAQDYQLAKRSCLKTFELSDEMLARGDFNGNGRIDASEYVLIKRHVLGTHVIR